MADLVTPASATLLWSLLVQQHDAVPVAPGTETAAPRRRRTDRVDEGAAHGFRALPTAGIGTSELRLGAAVMALRAVSE